MRLTSLPPTPGRAADEVDARIRESGPGYIVLELSPDATVEMSFRPGDEVVLIAGEAYSRILGACRNCDW